MPIGITRIRILRTVEAIKLRWKGLCAALREGIVRSHGNLCDNRKSVLEALESALRDVIM